MIGYIKGIITDTMPGKVVIENNGMGFEVNVPDNSAAFLTGENEIIILYTAMMVREDDISLYGFTDKQSIALFRLLMTVSGVGAKGAMAILSALNINELKKALIYEDVGAITKANGIGKKIAQRIVLELKDKVGQPEDIPAGIAPTVVVKGSAKDNAVQGLMALGYSKTEAMSAMVGITDESLSAEEYIRLALRNRR